MNEERKQYGNSSRFRMLKWLHPVLLTVSFAVCWLGYYVPHYKVAMTPGNQWLVLLLYLAVLYVLEKTYCALAVGLVRVGELVYSQSLAALICNGFAYVAGALYCNCFFNPLPLFIVLVVQFALSVLWSLGVNRIYYAHYPPPVTAIVYRDEADLQRIRSIRYFTDHFEVQKMIENPAEDAAALLAQLQGAQVVFVSGVSPELRAEITKYCVAKNIRGYFIPELEEIIMAGAEHMTMFSEPVMKVQRAQRKTEYLAIKRIMDIMISAVALVAISPVMLITALAIKLYDRGPVFYRQTRLTQNARTFSILKFRSMNVNAEKDGVARLASTNDNRITPIGKLIRATRIDELPQLINILLGDMSIVGPRPERPEIASEYEKTLPEFALRLQVKAGLTGLAQVYGRYNTEPYSKLQMDLMYINNVSLRTDLKLIFATVKILFMKESTEGVGDGQQTALKK